MIFSVYMIFRVHAVDISGDVVITRIVGNTQQEVRKVNARERTDSIAYIGEVEVAIVPPMYV
jgi:hypothetical protein